MLETLEENHALLEEKDIVYDEPQGGGLKPLLVPQGQRRIDFEGFLSALSRVAEKKGQAMEEVVRQILSAGGPTVTGTKAEYVKFHDDKVTLMNQL